MTTPKLFGREPALWIQTLTAIAAVVVGIIPAADGLAAAITSLVVAGFAAWQAFLVRPVAPTVFSGLIVAAAPLAGLFGLNLTQSRLGLFTAAVAAIMALLVRHQSTPADDPVDRPVAPAA